MFLEDFALNNLQWLIRHKNQVNQAKLDVFYLDSEA